MAGVMKRGLSRDGLYSSSTCAAVKCTPGEPYLRVMVVSWLGARVIVVGCKLKET